MAPLAVLLVTAFAVAESRGLYMVYSFSLGAQYFKFIIYGLGR